MEEVEEKDIKEIKKEIKIVDKVSDSTCEEIKATTGGLGSHIDLCVICLETVSERAVASPCRHHNFDFLCLVSWLQERSTCPLCNTPVHVVEFGWKSPKDFKVYKVTSSMRKTLSTFPPWRPSRFSNGQDQQPIPSWTPRRPQGQPPNDPDAALLRRKEIYSLRLYSSHVGSNRISRFRDLTPQLFVQNQELISRAKKWIRRELQVFQFLNSHAAGEGCVARRVNNADFLLEYIIAILKTVDVKGSQAEDMLQEFLGRDNTRLFLHELKAWLRSPYTTLDDWDRHVQYNTHSTVPEQCESRMGSAHPKAPAPARTSRRSDRYIPYRREFARCSRQCSSRHG